MRPERGRRGAGARHRGPGATVRGWLTAAAWAACALLAGCGPAGPEEGPEPPVPAGRGAPAEADGGAPGGEPAARAWPAGAPRSGQEVEAELAPEEVHRYRLPLEAGSFLRLAVEQLEVDAELSLEDPAGKALLVADRMIYDLGEELLLAVAETSGPHVLTVRGRPEFGAGRYRARIEVLRAASDRDRLVAATYRRFREAVARQWEAPAEAAATWEEVLETWRALGEPALEGEVLARLGAQAWYRRQWDRSAAYNRQALEAFRRAGDRYQQAVLHQGIASMLPAAEAGEAGEHYRASIALARELRASRLEAAALHGLGHLHHRQGGLQEALSHYEAALALLPETDTLTRPYTLHNLGVLYSLYFGDLERGRELLAAARDLWPESAGYDEWKARTLAQLARLALDAERPAEARVHLRQALAIPEGYDRCGRAGALARLALLEEEEGAHRLADARLEEAFARLAEAPCPRTEAAVQLHAGDLAARRGRAAEAVVAYGRARALAEAQGDRTRLAESLLAVARARRALGETAGALEASAEGLAILEAVRPTVLRQDLRTAFFSTTQEGFDLHVGLLRAQGREEEAWLAAERARARALQDLLAEAGAGLRREADPRWVAQERELQEEIRFLEARRREAFREPSAERLRKGQREIDALVQELEAVRGELRRQNPAYAALAAPALPSLSRVQRDLLDPSTLLLEYRLGEEASWLWAVTRETFAGFELPPRGEIEPLAREAVRATRSLRWPGRSPPSLCELSRTVLGPVAHQLAGRRLVVVADGALEEVSFAALPSPSDPGGCAEAPPLVAGHEIVHLPSAATLAAQRRLLEGRRPAAAWLAMVADPVYGPDDARLGPAGPRRGSAGGPGGSGYGFRRLVHSGEEAEAVLARLPRGRAFVARGLEATKGAVTGGSLGGHRIVHFATHGVLNPEQPLLSFLALSRVDADGRRVDGDLYAHEVYDLELPAELVVLSACDTALGRQVRGEGLVSGLPRAFLYAGAARVLVSLWPVPDRSTRELMALFYRRLVEEGLPPGQALQEAQRALWQAGRPPYQWAGFVLQGDWRPLPPF